MQRIAIAFMTVIVSVLSFAQQRYLVNQTGDIVPIPKGKSAASILANQLHGAKIASRAPACTPARTFGNKPNPQIWGGTTRLTFGHKDLIAIWYEAPITGSIDSLFIQMGPDSAGGYPGKLAARIHRSNIYTGNGPGWGPYLPPPKVCWGYFNNASDPDMHLAAFQDDGTDTTWISTYNRNNSNAITISSHFGELADTSLKTFPPAAEEIWGLGGVDVTIHPNAITAIDLSALPPKPEVTKGDSFFISFRDPGEHASCLDYIIYCDDPTLISVDAGVDDVVGAHVDHSDPDPVYRRSFHNWKFYEHDMYSAPGWLARGDVAFYIWYTMTADYDVPPDFIYVEQLGHTVAKGGTRQVEADVQDCNFIPGDQAIVDRVNLVYSVDNSSSNTVPMTNVGGTIWMGDIPGQSCGTLLRYYLEATDNNRNTSTSQSYTYRTLCMRNEWYLADTGATRTSGSIATDAGHHAIDTSAWFAPRNASAKKIPKDDGTVGPFPINPGFIYFDDTLHYAWVGVNGAIALSKTANDTIHVNSNGDYYSFSIPGTQRLPYPDTTTIGGVPRNIIAGFWADMIAGNNFEKYGNVYWKDETNRFVVEWDSIASASYQGACSYCLGNIFRIILNKNDGTMEFQYDQVGIEGLDSACLVAIQSDVTDSLHQRQGYHIINQNTYPYETKPRNNWCIKYWPILPIAMVDGWNLVSAPGTSPSYDKNFLFPHAASSGFYYEAGYKSAATINFGIGYWLKYASAQVEYVPAGFHTSQDVALGPKWNMIGSLTKVLKVTNITSTPLDLVTSPYFGYHGGYTAVTTIEPGGAYWVKALDAGGILHLNASSSLPKIDAPHNELSTMNTLTLRSGSGSQTLYFGDASLIQSAAYYELPPAPPEGMFDARFASQQMVETYPAIIEKGKTPQYVINVQNQSGQVTVQWNISKPVTGHTFVLTDGQNGKTVILNGTGSQNVGNVQSLMLKLAEEIALPKEYALRQNYPNPFNPTTLIAYELPENAFVTIKVYNLLGQEIHTLVNENKIPGSYNVEFDASNMPSGVYFYKMTAGKFSEQQKMMLIR